MEKYLSEEKYQKAKKKIICISLLVLVIGLLIGGSLIFKGLNNQGKINSKSLEEELEIKKQNLFELKTNLEIKIKPIEDEIKDLERVSFNGFNEEYYARQDKIEELEKSISVDKKSIGIIEEALDESFNHCEFEAKNNSNTKEYCKLKNRLTDDFSFDSIPLYIIGGFIIFVSCIIALSIYMTAKGREITAFGVQQVMPVAQEGIDKMSPTIGTALGTIAKGIKDGLKDDESDE